MLWTRLTGGSITGAVTRIQNPILVEKSDSICSGVEHAKLDGVFQKIRAEDEATEASGKKKSKHPMMVRAIWRTYKGEATKPALDAMTTNPDGEPQLIQAALLKLGWSVFIVLSIAYFIRSLLVYIQTRWRDNRHDDHERLYGLLHCIFFSVCMIILTFFLQQTNYVSARLGVKVQGAVTTQIYIKALHRAEGTGSKADIVAMVSKDCRKIADAITSLQFLWSGVFEAIVIFAVLLGFLGYNALPAVGVFFIMLPLQYKLGLWIAHKKAEISKCSSERAQLTEEILRSMKLIKTYAWEESFMEKVDVIRKKEIALYSKQTKGKTLLIASVFLMPPFFVAAIFGIYAINNVVTGSIAFTTLTLFNTLRLPLVKLPKALRDCTDSLHAIERIEHFLVEPEMDPKETKVKSSVPGIKMVNASFSHLYPESSKESVPYLDNISVDIKPGSLTMVAGSVGTGKSSFLKAILGQLHIVGGTSHAGGAYAYVPQSPWCALGTVRDNILFGKPYEETLYNKVCHACSLETDFKLFKDGDMTWIGERGGNLSGGQKQRIALARACYSQNDIIVLDSPLSAVDMHTGQHIFKYCIQELMIANGITVVLATHQVELFSKADTVIVMEDGNFKYCGPYSPAAMRKLFPNAHVSDGPAGGNNNNSNSNQQQPQQQQQQQNGMMSNPYFPHMAQTNAYFPQMLQADLMSGSNLSRSFMPQKAAPTKALKVPEEDPNIIVVPKTNEPRTKPPIKLEAGLKGGYWELIKNWGPLLTIIMYLTVFPASQGARTFSDIWISQWTAKINRWGPHILTEWEYYAVYVSMVFMFFVAQMFRGFFCFGLGLRATTRLHDDAFRAMMKAPMSFFNLTPIGKTLNFFSKDIDDCDDTLHDNIYMASVYIYLLIFTFYVLVTNVPIYAYVIGGVLLILSFVLYFYIRYTAIAKMHYAAGTSTVVSHTAETLTGLAVVRAFSKEAQFLGTNENFQDSLYETATELINLNHWLAIRVDMCGIILVCATVFIAVFFDDRSIITDSSAGLLISNSIQILLFLTAVCTTFGDINTLITSVAAAKVLKDLEPEIDIPKEDKRGYAPAGWPSKGQIDFSNVVMSYVPNTPAVLKGVNFNFKGGEKIGVVGRTGAGKSTLIMAMFRLAELTGGKIMIDNIDVTTLSMKELRSHIAIIPQEPVMFKGTLRTNLDPFHQHADPELVSVLKKCLLESLVDHHMHDQGLSHPVEVFGVNFSLGQQQLICLARAMLTPSKLLLLDEATAALDSDTDAKVQKVLRSNFMDRTIMTIAHRLDTIIDSDRILTMDAGKVAEFDTPKALLSNPKSIFSELCKNSGHDEYERLLKAANAKGTPGAGGGAGGSMPPQQPQFPGYGAPSNGFSMQQPMPPGQMPPGQQGPMYSPGSPLLMMNYANQAPSYGGQPMVMPMNYPAPGYPGAPFGSMIMPGM